uniref:Uncharacterized protein n=1 Tax=Tetranychus urticae TaxID=32264 RepID=T1JZ85_TETUR
MNMYRSLYSVMNHIYVFYKKDLEAIGMDENSQITIIYEIHRPINDNLTPFFDLFNYKDGEVTWHLARVLDYLDFLYQRALLMDEDIVKINEHVYDFVVGLGKDLEKLFNELIIDHDAYE